MIETPEKFDSHVHVLPAERLAGLMRWIHRGFPGHPVPPDIDEARIVADLREAGVSRFFNLVYPLRGDETASLNEWNLEFCRRTPEAIPFGSLFVDDPAPAETGRRLIEAGCVGIKLHPFVQKFDPDDPRLDPLYGFLNEAGRPLAVHTGFDEWYGRSLSPARIGALAARFPKMPLVIVHLLFPRLRECFQLAERDNIWLDATNVPGSFKYMARMGLKPDASLVDCFIAGAHSFADKMMYGSDHPAGMGGLADIYADLDEFALDRQVRDRLRGLTAARFYDLSLAR